MAAVAQTPPSPQGRVAWLWTFLKDELRPYRGRGALVARMVTASTLMMIISMTFQIPYGAYGAVYALTLSRESVEATASAVRMVAIGFVLGGAYAVVGAMLVLGNPTLRFLWVIATLFLIFYALSALSSYAASARFGYLIAITIPLWDRQIPAEMKVEGTLWAVGSITLASIITLLLEVAFAAFRRVDDLTQGIVDRLTSVEELLAHFADDRAVEPAAQLAITRQATVGTSRLRRMLQRSSYAPRYAHQMGALVALVGRLVDIAANLPQLARRVSENDRGRIRKVMRSLDEIRADLMSRTVPHPPELSSEGQASPGFPLLSELEKTTSLIAHVFTGSQSLSEYAPQPSEDTRQVKALVPGAFSNPEHVKFGLRGCLAASLCYFAYNFLFWPEISTAITTCLLTALSTVGASRQKQVLRFVGALVGGVGIGMGAQVFVLPYLDSIGGFTVLFVAVAAVAAWIATSSSRLSYFGVQVLVAFCLIHLQEFRIQTSLAVARDRVVGIMLGLLMMWLAFDHLWSAPAGIEMKKSFISAMRLLAQLAREPDSKDTRLAIEHTFMLREKIDTEFDKGRSLADGVLFEFGPSRPRDLVLRDRIRRWQPQLRTLFVMRTTSLKYRLQLPGFELPEAARRSQQEYDDRSARQLEDLADRIEGKAAAVTRTPDSLGALEQTLRTCCGDTPQVQTLVTLLRGIDGLTNSLAEEIAAEYDGMSG